MRYFNILLLILFIISGEVVSGQVREEMAVSGDWKFYKGNTDFTKIKTAEWQPVTIPHTWNVEDGQSGVENGYYRGTGIYSSTLNVPESMRNKRIFIRFEAVSSAAEVYLNGKMIGAHQGAFNAFCFELTNLVRIGGNRLVVKVTNEPSPYIAPLAGDFTIFGGIYRPVTLIALNPICITPLDYASSGVYIQQKDIRKNLAKLNISTRIVNGFSTEEKVKVKFSLFDAEGKEVTTSLKEVKLPVAGIAGISQEISVNKPVLWHGTENPYLYRAFVEVIHGEETVDSLSHFVGLRYFSVDPGKGFMLNGKPYQLKGVNRHQDKAGKGWAISEEDQIEDIEIMKEMGVNAVRLAHYPHSDYFYSLCDRNGILAWAEIPLIGHISDQLGFAENTKLQLAELIYQKYNHPSIFCWSLYNELGHPGGTIDPVSLVTELNDLAHAEDPSRFTVAASNIQGRPENSIPDHLAFNAYPGWYGGKPEDMATILKTWNELMGNRGIAVSEYGAGANIAQHEQNMTEAPLHNGKWHPEEWQAIVHEKNYECIRNSKQTWGSFVWNMFDFASSGRNEGNTPGINDKGLVTYDRKVKKDAYYFYKTNWSQEPVVYIAGRRHTERYNEITDIKVYSNCKKLKLSVNGIEQKSVSGKNGVFVWKDIPLIPGKNTISVSGTSGKTTITDTCEWVLVEGL